MEATLSALTGTIDMLSPFGKLLVNQHHEAEDACDEDSMLEVSNQVPSQDPSEENHSMPPLSIPYTHEGDLEDAIADEVPRNQSTSEIVIRGEKTTKAKALQHRMVYHASRSSTDRLKRVQQLPCFDAVDRITDSDTNIITSNDSPLGTPSLRVGNPVTLLV
jgi:hypothetical protein